MELSYMLNDNVFSRKRPNSTIHGNSTFTEPFKKRTCGEEHMQAYNMTWRRSIPVYPELNSFSTFEDRIQPFQFAQHEMETSTNSQLQVKDVNLSENYDQKIPSSHSSTGYQYLASSWRRQGITLNKTCTRCQAGEPGHINHIMNT